MSLLNSSFSAHSLPSPPSLGPFLSSLTHLTLANVGLPAPSTHLTDMLALCTPHLEYLALSSLRDVDEREFQRALAVLVHGAHRLQSVKLGFLTDEQVRAMCAPLPLDTPALPTPPPSPTSLSGSGAPADPPPAIAPALSLLPSVTHLTFTLPLPSSPLLLSLPAPLQVLTIRPPYSRPSASSLSSSGPTATPTIFGTSRESLLRVLDRRRAFPGRVGTPVATPARVPSERGQARSAGDAARGPSSFTLEQLEEEERVVLALEEALGRSEGAAARGRVPPRLREVRWEGRALRSARARIAEALARRERDDERERERVRA